MDKLIEYEDFAKLDLRVTTIEKVELVEGADKLFKLTVNDGGGKRILIAGLRGYYKSNELEGKQIIIIANLKPRTLRGVTSQGMLLAATDNETGKVLILTPEHKVSNGSKIS